MTTNSVTGPVPLDPPGLPNAGQVGTNSISVDETNPDVQIWLASIMYAIGYRNVIPNPTPQGMVANPTPDTTPPTPGYQAMIPDPSWQTIVPQTQSPGMAWMLHLQIYMNQLAAQGAAQLEKAAVAAAQAEAATYSAAVAAVTLVVS
jgi:hypothetical protein